MKETKEVVPFDSFSAVYKMIILVGYCKLDKKARKCTKIFYEIYRRLALAIVIVYNVQFFIYTFQSRKDIEKMSESLMLDIINVNLFVKTLTLFILDTRLLKLNQFLKGGIFCATNEIDQKILQNNAKQMYRLFRIMNTNTTLAVSFWGFRSIFKRYVNGEYEVVPMYFPFKTDTVFRFFLLLLNSVVPLLWVANGHTAIDILIATYYAQAHTQLKIIRQQLKSLLDEMQNDGEHLKFEFQYKDLLDKTIKDRFISVVKRYKKMTWYVKEVDSIFNVSLSFQFLSSTVAVCFGIYSLTTASTSYQILFIVFMFIFSTTQIFLYCLFGNFVFIESQLLNESLYKSDWLSLSPSFRRLLLVAMVRWSKPVQPQVCGIVRLSLSTFLSIIKASYTLYTVLIVMTKNEEDN